MLLLLSAAILLTSAIAEMYFKACFHYTGSLHCPSGNVGNASVWLMEENDFGYPMMDDKLSGEDPIIVKFGHPFEINGRIDWPAYEGRHREPFLHIRHYCSADKKNPSSHPFISYYSLPSVSALDQRVSEHLGPINVLLDATVALDRRAGTMDDHDEQGPPPLLGRYRYN